MKPAARCGHYTAAAAAVCAAALLLGGIDHQARRLIAERAGELAPLNLPEAARGVALQHQILQQPDILPIYGSSELVTDQPTRPALFFQAYPRGFTVFPIGSPGDRCLIILQELAALADVIRGRRLVIFLSPQWFAPPPNAHQDHSAHRQFASRFSPLEADATVLGNALSSGLQRDIAGRLLDYGSVLRVRSPVLDFACTQMRSPAWTRVAVLGLLAPLGAAEDLAWRLQDRWQTLALIRGRSGNEGEVPATGAPMETLDWPGLAGHLVPPPEETDAAAANAGPASARDSSAAFLRRMNAAPEWIDLALLLRTIRELRVDALLIGQPMNGRLSEQSGVSAQARRVYYERVQRLAAASGTPLRDFSGHEDEPEFFADRVHPSARAWLYYDRTLDEFYHHRKR
jgi:D-alanine transfer protein